MVLPVEIGSPKRYRPVWCDPSALIPLEAGVHMLGQKVQLYSLIIKC